MRLGLPPRLPSRRNAGSATKRNEQHRMHAAVAPKRHQRLFAETWNRAVLLLGTITHGLSNEAEDLSCRGQRIGFTSNDVRRGLADLSREVNVRRSLRKLIAREITR